MLSYNKLPMMAALIGTVSFSSMAIAQQPPMDPSDDTSVTAKSVTQVTKTAPAPTSIMMYDLNGDGMLSAAEIGNKLFYQFDRDGNESIDNIEWNKPLKVDFAPVEKVTVTKIDIDGDGVDEQEAVNVDVFLESTGLERFDTDGNGISPREFTGKSVLEMDTDKSGLIEMKEWQKAYVQMRAPKAANNEIYNDGQ